MMEMKLLARIGAIAFVALAITVTAITVREAPKAAPHNEVATVPDTATADPLAAELRHCQSIGQAGASDVACLEAWAENRRRFLGVDARPEARPSDFVGRDR